MALWEQHVKSVRATSSWFSKLRSQSPIQDALLAKSLTILWPEQSLNMNLELFWNMCPPKMSVNAWFFFCEALGPSQAESMLSLATPVDSASQFAHLHSKATATPLCTGDCFQLPDSSGHVISHFLHYLNRVYLHLPSPSLVLSHWDQKMKYIRSHMCVWYSPTNL